MESRMQNLELAMRDTTTRISELAERQAASEARADERHTSLSDQMAMLTAELAKTNKAIAPLAHLKAHVALLAGIIMAILAGAASQLVKLGIDALFAGTL